MKRSIIQADESYTFSKYPKLRFALADIVAHFGYTVRREPCTLPHVELDLARFSNLKERLQQAHRTVNLSNEAARREVLIAPILLEVAFFTQAQFDIEYYLEVSPQLQGVVDYYLHQPGNLLVVKAKHENLDGGFNQLAVELIAFDHWTDSSASHLFGAVSLGEIWRFGVLDRASKAITQDLNLYRVPADIDALLPILVGILQIGD